MRGAVSMCMCISELATNRTPCFSWRREPLRRRLDLHDVVDADGLVVRARGEARAVRAEHDAPHAIRVLRQRLATCAARHVPHLRDQARWERVRRRAHWMHMRTRRPPLLRKARASQPVPLTLPYCISGSMLESSRASPPPASKMGSHTMQTLQEPILLQPWVSTRDGEMGRREGVHAMQVANR